MSVPRHKVFAAKRGFLCRNGQWTTDEDQASVFDDFAAVVQLCLRFGITSVIFIIYNGGTRIEWPLCLS